MESEETSEGLIDLLLRHSIKPSGNYKSDVEKARKFMNLNGKEYKEYLKKLRVQ